MHNPKCDEAPGCGEWKRPFKANPEYKGKWYAPMIDNPAYIGEWAPRKIPNPDFFEDLTPVKSLKPIVSRLLSYIESGMLNPLRRVVSESSSGQ